MYKFKDFENIIEAKNTHLTHIEDKIFDGVDETRQVINQLRALRNMLSGHTSNNINITVKWDGCVHPSTILMTNYGEMTINQLIENYYWMQDDIKVMGLKNPGEKEEYSTFVRVLDISRKNGTKDWVEIELEDGSSIKLTEDHEVYTTNRGWVKAIDLKEDDDINSIKGQSAEDTILPIAKKIRERLINEGYKSKETY